VADLSIADVSIVLQQGVWVGVIQHGPSSVVSSTVGDPVGKQHIVKLHAKPCLFSQTSSCNLHACKMQGPAFGVAYVVTLLSPCQNTLCICGYLSNMVTELCILLCSLLTTCRFVPVQRCSPEKRHTCMCYESALLIAIAATSFTHGVFALVAYSYMPCSCRNAVLYRHLVMNHLCGCSGPQTKHHWQGSGRRRGYLAFDCCKGICRGNSTVGNDIWVAVLPVKRPIHLTIPTQHQRPA